MVGNEQALWAEMPLKVNKRPLKLGLLEQINTPGGIKER